ncbi:MAG: carbon storage regulator [Gemmatimonadaceae bacterium]|nr:carbon storage regulator [Gemmatimonadaceae bacterium]
MLILGRREGESILIEGGIRIVVVSCERGGVRIGIEAPPEVKILRGEIADKIALENQRATTVPASSALLASLVGGAATAALSSTAAMATAESSAPSDVA